ncbi:DNA topoisomerase III [Paludibacter sp. 221]|uniref:DNA topoisomerase 3 n=1 Tax=Paludibacter sp. 221 TaxID=2302939 RepID=UPI0013D1E77A|nr:DNA topoisomerase 3 [Paludibacter sp. 221]NDV45861.1 DNA topoisomerase III [Paludibacter sp. 221]
MIVCIAEKPSVARDIAEILGAKARKDGYIEGNGYQVTWTFGHLCGLLEPHDYAPEWKPWALSRLPMIPQRFGIKVMDDKGIQKQFQVIEKLVQSADEVINCGDAGQEGELIQRWVLQKALCKCPVKRLWISSLTEDAIREGFAKLKKQDEYQRLYEAGLSRAIGDWLLGMNATRLYTLKYGKNKQVLSIGRVQTPTLALIVNRQLEIENFKPEAYWELKTVYRDTVFSATKGRFSSVEEGTEFLRKVKEAPFTVTDTSVKKGTESAPRLFDLTSLQVECNKKFGYSADDTLKIIQSLYEKKITTYPRVDTTYLSDDMYPKVPNILKGLKDYELLTKPLLETKLPKTKKVFDNKKVTDHHAIIPTGMNPSGLTDTEKRVFDLVARRFIANFYPECKISTTTVLGEAGEVEFKVTGKQILEAGWRIVFDKAKEEDENNKEADEDKTLPLFEKGESGPHDPDLAEKWTSPPKPYTEATLLRAMETAGKLVDNEELRDALKENGIGRPSTRAAIIETLFKRGYIRKERKNLIATQTGVELIQTIQEDLLKSAELTGMWEKKLRQIESGEYQAKDFLDELKDMVCKVVLNVKSDNRTIDEIMSLAKQEKDPIVGTVCPLCGKGTLLKGKTAYGCSQWKSGCEYRKPF